MSTVDNTTTSAPTRNIRTLEDMNSAKREVKTTLGKDEFLSLLVAQMANQDPLSPTSDTDFIAQLAQFSSLEQMQSLNASFQTQQAYSLIGKYVYAVKVVSGVEYLSAGVVDGVINESGTTYLVIGEGKFLPSEVIGISNMYDTGDSFVNQAALIGKQVTASYTETVVENEGTEEEVSKEVEYTYSGTVTQIYVKDGVGYAKIKAADGTVNDAPLYSINSIGEADDAGGSAG